MGYGKELIKKSPCTRHRYVRKVRWADNQVHVEPVGLRSPLHDDYCNKCGCSRGIIELLGASLN